MTTVAALLFCVVGGGLAAWFMSIRDDADASVTTPARALELLERREYAAARRIALDLLRRDDPGLDDERVPAFVLGAVAVHNAGLSEQDARNNECRRLFLLASRYLQYSRTQGFPAGRESEATYLLGLSLLKSGDAAQAAPVLKKALDANSENRPAILEALATAQLRAGNLQQAGEVTFRWLSTPGLSDAQRQRGHLLQAEILLHAGDVAKSRAALQDIPATSPQSLDAGIMRGRLMILEANSTKDKSSRDEKLLAALDILQRTDRNRKSKRIESQAEYLMAVCERKLGKLDEAQRQFAHVADDFDDTDVAVAASLDLADLQRAQDRLAEAAASYATALRRLPAELPYENAWISQADFRTRVLAARADFIESRNFAHAVRVAESLWPLFDRPTSLTLLAETHAAWGEFLAGPSDPFESLDDRSVPEQATEQFRIAGRAYAQLARIRVATHSYADDLWLSATNLLKGRDYRAAIGSLDEYVKNGQRGRIAAALLALGQAHLALGQLDQARSSLLQCIEFHASDPSSFRARIVASQVYAELGDFEEAKKLLLDNLENPNVGLRPESVEWRESLFSLGALLFREAELAELRGAAVGDVRHAYEAARLQLSDAVRRFDSAATMAAESFEARYRIARSLHRIAMLSPESAGNAVDPRQQLREAADLLLHLQDDLLRVADQRPLAEPEAKILRNSFFSRADALFDLADVIASDHGAPAIRDEFQTAADAYLTAAARYSDAPEAMNGFVRAAECYRRGGESEQARTILRRAQRLLARVADGAGDAEPPGEATAHVQHWSNVLDLLIQL